MEAVALAAASDFVLLVLLESALASAVDSEEPMGKYLFYECKQDLLLLVAGVGGMTMKGRCKVGVNRVGDVREGKVLGSPK